MKVTKKCGSQSKRKSVAKQAASPNKGLHNSCRGQKSTNKRRRLSKLMKTTLRRVAADTNTERLTTRYWPTIGAVVQFVDLTHGFTKTEEWGRMVKKRFQCYNFLADK